MQIPVGGCIHTREGLNWPSTSHCGAERTLGMATALNISVCLLPGDGPNLVEPATVCADPEKAVLWDGPSTGKEAD